MTTAINVQPCDPVPQVAEVGIVDELSVEGVYRRYGQRRNSAACTENEFNVGAEPIADPAHPQYSFERVLQYSQSKIRDKGWEMPTQTVSIQDLTVTVKRKASHIPTVASSALRTLISPYTVLRQAENFTKLHNINGLCLPGEMVLVMGPPGSGCSTLLRVLSGRRSQYTISGSVLYNGSPNYERLHLGLIGEEDRHLPSLTVEQTFKFAAEMAVPLLHPQRQKMDRLVNTLLHLLGLYRVKDTVVGDGMLRGVSGGEKKRVTIGEMLCSRRGTVLCFDGWSKGLDSAAALDICKTARVVANTLNRTIVMSQYQASAEMFDLFDKVLLLDAGHQIYFGPVRGAVQYFELLGLRCPVRRTIPDFLATVVEDVEDLGVPGSHPPTTREGFAAAFRQSEAAQQLRSDIQAAAHAPFMCPPMSAEAEASLQAKYSTPFYNQLRHCVRREALPYRNNRRQMVYPRIIQKVIMALVLGLLFFNLPLNKAGAYSRSGLLFQQLNFMAFSSFSTIPPLIFARGVFLKQRDASFFHPMAWYLSMTLAELPLSIVEILLFGGITYWMAGRSALKKNYNAAGLYASFSHFVFYLFVLWLTTQAIGNLIRLFACVSRDLSGAQSLAAAVMVSMVFFSGFMIPKGSLPVFWKWAYWVSPLHYPLHALLINEFYPLTFYCAASELQPPSTLLRALGVNGTFEKYQVCQIPGYPTGPRTGKGYLMATYDITDDEGFVWFDVLILAAFLALFLILAGVALTKLSFSTESSHVRYLRQPASDEVGISFGLVSNEDVREFEAAAPRRGNTMDRQRDFGGCREAYLTWNHLCYEVFVPAPGRNRVEPEPLKLLQEVHGFCVPGSLVALMGSSGAGKTTLLDVLAMRKTGGRVTGDVKVNGAMQDTTFRRISGYVEQEDNHQPMATIREAFSFAARLRLPAGTGEHTIVAVVDSTLSLLGLESLQHAMIGSDATDGNIPLEARKRVTIGVELVANPSILFMDEPTSGLDTRGALIVMKAARRIADSGRAVICTIHQPSAEIFEMFDNLLLLARGGRTVYFGPIGAGSQTLLSYFERNGAQPCPANVNPAEYILDAIGSGIGRNNGDRDWPDIWQRSREFQEVYAQRDSVVPANTLPFVIDESGKTHGLQFPGVKVQFCCLAQRTFLAFWRTPSYNLTRHIFAIAVGLLLGSAYFQLGSTQKDLQQHVACLYFSIFLAAIAMFNSMIPLFTERQVFSREVVNGSYRRRVYATVSGLVEIPFLVTATLCFVTVFYWMVGMPRKADRFIFALLDYFALQIFSVFLGQAIAALAPALLVAMGVTPLLMSIWMLHLGFLIPEGSIPVYFKVFNIVNPYKYFMRSFVASSLHGHEFYCTEGQYLAFPRPPLGCPNQPASRWSSTHAACLLCPNISGDEYLSFYSWKFETRWKDLGVLLASAVAFRILTYVAISKRQYQTR